MDDDIKGREPVAPRKPGTTIGANPPSKPPGKGTPITVQGLAKVMGIIFPIIVTVVAAVIYLEHRFQNLDQRLTKVEVAVQGNTQSVNKLRSDNDKDHIKMVKALEAIDTNQRELTVDFIYCCELSKTTAKKVMKRHGSSGSSPILTGPGPKPSSDILELLGETGSEKPDKALKDVLPYNLSFSSNPGKVNVITQGPH